MLRVFGINTHLGPVHNPSARTEYELGSRSISQKRSSLSHTVTHCKWQPNLAEPFLHIRIERSATHNNHTDIASESTHEFLAYLLENHILDTWEQEKEPH